MSSINENCMRQEICRIGKLLHLNGFVAGYDGNISVRLEQDFILSTPTCICKGMMRPEDLVVVNMNGDQVQGMRLVTSEIAMHMLFYCMRPDIQAVVHAHPPIATGFAASGIALNEPLIAEVVASFGVIPLAPYGTPGTAALSDTLRPLIPGHDAILMANHGVVTAGRDLVNAYLKMEKVEHCARIVLVAHQLGTPQPLSAQEVQKLLQAHQQYEENAASVFSSEEKRGPDNTAELISSPV